MKINEKHRWGISTRFFGPIELDNISIMPFHTSVKDGTFKSKDELIKALENKIEALKREA